MNNVCSDLGIDNLTAEEITEILVEFDINRDGKLQLNEFEALMHKIIETLDEAQESNKKPEINVVNKAQHNFFTASCFGVDDILRDKDKLTKITK